MKYKAFVYEPSAKDPNTTTISIDLRYDDEEVLIALGFFDMGKYGMCRAIELRELRVEY